LQTICLDWLWIVSLLISASWVPRITGVSQWSPADMAGFKLRSILEENFFQYNNRNMSLFNIICNAWSLL
jgi:hypothetical protein